MDYSYLAETLFGDIKDTPEELEKRYPKRKLKENAKVTRMAPSPTGFMHLGNLFAALTAERLAHQSEGIFYLRIEDTDQKREVEGGVEAIINAFSRYNLNFDEGATIEGDKGDYGPYRQRQREKIYKVFAKELVKRGLAYPCFCSEEELSEMRIKQENLKINFGYYGEWAIHRDMPIEEIEKNIKAGQPYVLRFKSMGDTNKKVVHKDLIKGTIEMPENDQDIVLLKSDGIPTYHFAHIVDDHLMKTTHVVRGDEWLATLPIHLQLFDTFGWQRPEYLHISPLMKQEGETKRKLSKRKDPELALDFYHSEGYPVPSVLEYLLTLLNSNYEEWRMANPTSNYNEFPFSPSKMSSSGALFDLVKLIDVSKNTLANLSAEELYHLALNWTMEFDKPFYELLAGNKEYALKILSIGRGVPKPRKDIALLSEIKGHIEYCYDELFAPKYEYPQNISKEDVLAILNGYKEIYNENDENDVWFGKIKELSESIGFAGETKAYKKNPELYKGSVGDVSMVLRVAVTGRTNSLDMFEVMRILGKDRVLKRLDRAINN